MKRRLSSLLLFTTIAASAAAYVAFRLSPTLQNAVIERGARAQVSRPDPLPPDSDSLRVLLCGTSSPMPARDAAKSCTIIAAGEQIFLIDIGPEASENLALWRVPVTRIEHVFLTHFHSDHIGELGEFNFMGWAQGRRQPLQVHGPEGVEQVVDGFNTVYALDSGYRHAHHDHGKGLMPPVAAVMQSRLIGLARTGEAPQGRSAVVFEQGGVKVTAIEVDHRPVTPAFAYRFDYRGRSVVISGDTTFYPPLVAAARGADVLVSEAEAHHMLETVAGVIETGGDGRLAGVLRDTTDYHLTPVQAAQLANEAGVRELVFTHIAPPIPWRALPFDFIEVPWLRGVSEVRKSGVHLGHDGMLITLPADGGAVQFSRLRG
ncbi:MAG: MBL fold metallo-hydrolase [Xanthomonadales bacterium]|jgi:ribonuclease Z|nr:MBL fold metallo-hydrolase [Xanthomonadales bacterium]